MPAVPPALNTWTDDDSVTHGVDIRDVGYTDPVYDWGTWCPAAEYIEESRVDQSSLKAITCIACMRKL